MLPIPADCLHKVKGAAVIPVGIHTQETIGEDSEMKIKKRATRDATFPPPSNKSINNSLIREQLTDCFYGHCFDEPSKQVRSQDSGQHGNQNKF